MSDRSPPSPVDEFVSELRRLYDAAGRPTYRTLIGHGQMQDPPLRLSAQSLSDWLTGKSVPKASPAARFLIVHLESRAKRRAQARGETYQPRGLESWMRLRRRAWDHTHAQRSSHATTPARVSSSSSPNASTTPTPASAPPASSNQPRPAAEPPSEQETTHQPTSQNAARRIPLGASNRSVTRLLTPLHRARITKTVVIRIVTALIGTIVLVPLLVDQPLHQDHAPPATPPATSANRPPDRALPTPTPRPRPSRQAPVPLLLELEWAGNGHNLCGPAVRNYPSTNTLLHLIRRERSRLDDFQQSVGEVSFLIKSTAAAPLTVHQVGVRILRIVPPTGIRAYPRRERLSYCSGPFPPGIPANLSRAASGLTAMTAFEALDVDPSIMPLPLTMSRPVTGHVLVYVAIPHAGFIDYEWQIGVSWSAPTDPPGTRRWTAIPRRFRTSTATLYSYTSDGQLRVEDPGTL